MNKKQKTKYIDETEHQLNNTFRCRCSCTGTCCSTCPEVNDFQAHPHGGTRWADSKRTLLSLLGLLLMIIRLFTGKVFAMLAVCDNAVPLFSGILYSQLYNATINTAPSSIYWLTFTTQVLLIFLILWVKASVKSNFKHFFRYHLNDGVAWNVYENLIQLIDR